MPKALQPHPDRALPAGEARDLARRIHASTKDLPLLCLHGHVDISLFATDAPFGDPAELLVVPDHYVTRMLISQGISRAPRPAPPRRRPGSRRGRSGAVLPNWHLFGPPRAGTGWNTSSPRCSASPLHPSAETADELFDRISARSPSPTSAAGAARPIRDRADLHHRRRHGRPGPARQGGRGSAGRVVPTFRPDAVVHLDRPDWADLIQQLGALADVDTSTYDGICRRSGSGGRPLWRPARGRPTTGTSVPRRFRCPMRRRRGSTRVR